MKPAFRRRFLLLSLVSGLGLASFTASPCDAAGVLAGKMISMDVGGDSVGAYLVEPHKAAVGAGLVVVHERWGLNDQIKGVADRAATLGYLVIVPDLFRGKVPADAGLARAAARDLDDARARSVIRAAAAHLRARPESRTMPVGLVGFDIGGRLALRAALDGAPVQAVVMFYGPLEKADEAVARLQVPLLGFFGDLDISIPADDVRKFQAALKKSGKTSVIRLYPGVWHSFFNEQRASFDREMAIDAWDNVRLFLSEHLLGKRADAR